MKKKIFEKKSEFKCDRILNKYVLSIINYQFYKSITRHNALLKRIFRLLLGKIMK